MPKLCLITVPGLEVRSDWRLVHDRLLDEFPQVSDVLPTTISETILVVYDEAAPGDPGRWLDTVSDTILAWRRNRSGTKRAARTRGEVHRGPRRASAGAHLVALPG